jgi:hypothetical protein
MRSPRVQVYFRGIKEALKIARNEFLHPQQCEVPVYKFIFVGLKENTLEVSQNKFLRPLRCEVPVCKFIFAGLKKKDLEIARNEFLLPGRTL